LIYLFGFIGSILAANALIATFSVIPVGFGLLAPAGVLALLYLRWSARNLRWRVARPSC
jgi:hypothetical protein